MRQAYLRSHHLRRHSRRGLTAPFESRNLRRFYPEDLEEFRSQCGGSCSGNMLVFAGESLSYLSQGKVPALMWRAVPLTKPPKTKPAPGAPPHRPAMSCLFRARASCFGLRCERLMEGLKTRDFPIRGRFWACFCCHLIAFGSLGFGPKSGCIDALLNPFL